MELSMEFWFGFLMNAAGSMIMLWPCFVFLTLKKNHRPFETLVYLFVLIIPTTFTKYSLSIDYNNYFMLDVITNLILLIWLKWAFCDNIVRCAAAHVMMLGNGIIAAGLWVWIWGEMEMHQRNPGYMYFTHMICVILVTPIFSFILKRLKLKDWTGNRWFYIFSVCIIVNVLSMINLNENFTINYAVRSLLNVIPFILVMAECMIAVYIVYRMCIQKEKLDRLANLSALRKHEEENYNHLCRKTERMAKLRHDFKGQLFVARHIASVDYDEGIRMIEELRRNMEESTK